MTDDPVKGKTIRWRYTDGPVAGKEFEHEFGTDRTVRYRIVEAPATPEGTDGWMNGERPRYEVERINDDVFVISYLAKSGYTLTTVLDERKGAMVSFASNEKGLVVQRGTFEVREPVRRA
jgi:molybdenum cofactor biosynthesis protein MoaF